MKIAVLGGTFNPLHNGHVMIARMTCEKLGYHKVIFVPSFLPPHKLINSRMSALDRLEMVQTFCRNEGNGKFVCEPCEVERGGVSYTCDTLEYISEKYKSQLDGKPAFILGEESAAEFHKWKNTSRIVELADLIVAGRQPGKTFQVSAASASETLANSPSGNFTGDFSTAFKAENFHFPYTPLENPLMKISSSEIRMMISENKIEWEQMVPSSVCEYIKQKALYKN